MCISDLQRCFEVVLMEVDDKLTAVQYGHYRYIDYLQGGLYLNLQYQRS